MSGSLLASTGNGSRFSLSRGGPVKVQQRGHAGVPQADYHVTSQENEREATFRDDLDRNRFLVPGGQCGQSSAV